MADFPFDIMTSTDQIRDNYEKFKDKYVESGSNGIDQETFLKLLVAEMSNQDPLEPTSNTEFISQLAQFSSMQYMQEAGKYAQANYASSLVGKTVSVYKVEGKDVITITDVVQKVTKKKDGSFTVTVNDEEFALDKIMSVSETVKKDEPSGDEDDKKVDNVIDPNELGDRIARASAMIEAYATVGVGTVDDKGGYKEIKQGFIEAIQVNAGKINVIVGGKTYPIENIIEVTHAYIIDDPDDPGNTEDPGGPQGVEGSEGVEGGDNKSADNTDVSGSAASSAEADGFIHGGEDIPDIPDVSDMPEDEAIAQIMDIIQSMGG